LAYGIDEAETLTEVVDVEGGCVLGGAEGDGEAVLGAEVVVGPLCEGGGRTVRVAAALLVAGGGGVAVATWVISGVLWERALTAAWAESTRRAVSSRRGRRGITYIQITVLIITIPLGHPP
jgi:hypothetical protein